MSDFLFFNTQYGLVFDKYLGMKLKLLILFISLLLTSCANNFVFERKVYESNYSPGYSNSYNSAQIKIDVIEAKNSDSLNKIIFDNIRELTRYIDNQSINVKNYNQITKNFIQNYKSINQKNASEKLSAWKYDLESSVSYETENVLNISLVYHVSYGKESGFGGKKSILIDKISGKQMTLEDLFDNIPQLKYNLEKKFRAKYTVDSRKSYNSQGFCFEDNKFYMTDNVFFDSNGVTFFYNINEISTQDLISYEIFFPYEEINSFLKIE